MIFGFLRASPTCGSTGRRAWRWAKRRMPLRVAAPRAAILTVLDRQEAIAAELERRSGRERLAKHLQRARKPKVSQSSFTARSATGSRTAST